MNQKESLEKLSKKNAGKILEFQDEINELIKELKTIQREPRASAILLEAYIGYACDKLLAYKFDVDSDVFDHLNLRSKKELLQRLGIIDKKLSDDIGKIQEIRNIFAHRRKVKDQNTLLYIEHKVKSTNAYKTLNPNFKDHVKGFELFMTVCSRILALFTEKYQMMQITEINNYTSEFKDGK